MTPEERERAERWIKANWPIDLRADGEPWEDDVYCLLTLMREERARVWEEAADRVGPHDDLYFEWRLKAKMLREEGGNHVQDRRTRENRRVRL